MPLISKFYFQDFFILDSNENKSVFFNIYNSGAGIPKEDLNKINSLLF